MRVCTLQVKAQANTIKRKVQDFFGAVQLTLDLTGTSLDDQLTVNAVCAACCAARRVTNAHALARAQVGWRLLQGESGVKSATYDFGPGLEVPTTSLHAYDE